MIQHNTRHDKSVSAFLSEHGDKDFKYIRMTISSLFKLSDSIKLKNTLSPRKINEDIISLRIKIKEQ